MSDSEIHLDRESNLHLFERIAKPSIVDQVRLNELKDSRRVNIMQPKIVQPTTTVPLRIGGTLPNDRVSVVDVQPRQPDTGAANVHTSAHLPLNIESEIAVLFDAADAANAADMSGPVRRQSSVASSDGGMPQREERSPDRVIKEESLNRRSPRRRSNTSVVSLDSRDSDESAARYYAHEPRHYNESRRRDDRNDDVDDDKGHGRDGERDGERDERHEDRNNNNNIEDDRFDKNRCEYRQPEPENVRRMSLRDYIPRASLSNNQATAPLPARPPISQWDMELQRIRTALPPGSFPATIPNRHPALAPAAPPTTGDSGISIVSTSSYTGDTHRPQPTQQPPQIPSASRTEFANIRARIRQQRQESASSQARSRAGGGGNGEPVGSKPVNGSRTDPDYYEKKELLLRIETMAALGFTFPSGLDYSTPIEDLKSEISRKEVAMNTISDVDYVIGWIKTVTEGIQGFNAWCGDILPLNDYSERVAKRVKEPRFRYAIYQLLLRYKRQGSGSPWKEVILVLVLPLIECIVVKIVQYFARDRVPINGTLIDAGVRSLFGMGTDALKSKSKVPDIDGVTVNMGPADDGIDRRTSAASRTIIPPHAATSRPTTDNNNNNLRPPRRRRSRSKSTDRPQSETRPRRMPRPTDHGSDSDTGGIVSSRDVM